MCEGFIVPHTIKIWLGRPSVQSGMHLQAAHVTEHLNIVWSGPSASLKCSECVHTCVYRAVQLWPDQVWKGPGHCYSFQKSIMLWVLGNRLGAKGLKWIKLTGTVHLVTLVLTCCPAVTLPGHWDTLHLPTAAGKLPRAAALLWNTTREFVWSKLHVTAHFSAQEENILSPSSAEHWMRPRVLSTASEKIRVLKMVRGWTFGHTNRFLNVASW